MFEPVLDRPRGLWGHPLIPLLSAVAAGGLLSDTEVAVSIACVAIALLGYLWSRAES